MVGPLKLRPRRAVVLPVSDVPYRSQLLTSINRDNVNTIRYGAQWRGDSGAIGR